MEFDKEMAAMVDELAILKSEEGRIKERAKAVKERLDRMLEFGGKRTLHLFGDVFKATVQARTDIKWDQERIEGLRQAMPEEEFLDLFKWEYKHSSKKTLDGYLKHSPFKKAIKEAFTEVAASNYYTFDPLEGANA
jgi:hypothetical protein